MPRGRKPELTERATVRLTKAEKVKLMRLALRADMPLQHYLRAMVKKEFTQEIRAKVAKVTQ